LASDEGIRRGVIGMLHEDLVIRTGLNDSWRELIKNIHPTHRRALAVATLLRLREASLVWPLLESEPDPWLCGFLIRRLIQENSDVDMAALLSRENILDERRWLWPVDPMLVLHALNNEPDQTARRAIILCLAHLSTEQLPENDRALLLTQLQEIDKKLADTDIHVAVEMVARRWHLDAPTR
jgi:hypothetical protein